MANYSLVANSTFQPFTYQELAAPLDRMELYHEKLAEEYDKLSSQADVLEAMGKNDRDKSSGAYSRYKAYSDSLRKEADDLYKFGLNTESRQRLSDLRRKYNTDIVPIQNAWTKREKEAEDQMKASLANPSLMFTRDARTTSLDDYIVNPTGGYGVINGANITAQMAGMAKNLEKEVRNGTIKRTDIDPYLYDIIIEHGLDANTIRDWRNNPTLTAMFQQVMKANGVTPETLANSSNAQSILDKSTSYAEMGMWSAIGERKDEFKENYGKRLEAQKQKEIEVARAKGEIPGGPSSSISDSTISLPMQGADYSYAGEQERAMQTLGFKKNKDGKLVYNHGKIDIDIDFRDQTIRRLKEKIDSNIASEQEKRQYRNLTIMPILSRTERNKSKFKATVNLYNSDGSLMTKEQFAAQGKNEVEKESLRKYYTNIEEANQTLGIGQGTSYNHQQLTAHYNALRSNNAAQFAEVRALNYEKGDWNPTTKNYPVREIKSYRGGKPIFETKAMSLGELLERKNNNKEDIPVAPYWSEVEGHEGLILATTEDGKPHRYFISAENMPESNVREARRMFKEARLLAQAGREADARARTETAMARLHTGFTLHNSGQRQDIVRQPSLKQQGLAD
jgi:hypothetical protein